MIAPIAAVTPLFSSRLLSEACGATVLLKAENLQRTGSFKIRGATNKIARLGDGARSGVVVASAGNHAQAVASAARAAGVPCEVFMPVDASISKLEATASYGATVHLVGASLEDALVAAKERAAESGAAFIHPFDDLDVVAGQGTLGLELVEEVPDLARVIVPLGGGGLISGVAFALSALAPAVTVIGVQAEACAPFVGDLLNPRPPTLADGIAVSSPGVLTRPLVERLVDEVVAVSEDEIAEAIVLLLERSKLVVEGAGAVGVSALLSRAVTASATGTTVVVLSGGNIDTGLLTPAIRRHETNAGRRVVLYARVSDRPGELAKLLTFVGSTGANLLAVEHLREGVDLHVRETAVQLTLETRNHDHAASVLASARAAGYAIGPVRYEVEPAMH